MTPEARALVTVSAALAARSPERLDAALQAALHACDAQAVEEALVQSYLFLGYPVALNALARWRALSDRGAGAPEGDVGDFADRGADVCQRVYGGQYERLRQNIRALHPDMERWMVEEGYGRVIGRPGLSLEGRELCIVAVLAVQEHPRQLYSHLRGALNVGALREDIDETLSIAAEASTEAARMSAAETWASLRDRQNRREGD